MATRLAHIGWEQGLAEANMILTPSANLSAVSTTKARTGNYSLANSSGTLSASYGRTIPPTTELRAYTSINHNLMTISTNAVDRQAYFFYLLKADGTQWRFGWHRFNSLLYITSTAGTSLASAADSIGNITATDVWHDIGIAVKVDAAAGWLKLYCNGVEAVSFTGNTGTSPVVAVMVGGTGSSNIAWLATAYFDDLYIDDTTGEAASVPEARKFFYVSASGNGASSQWTGNDGNSTDNYLLVDDVAQNDGSTTYVAAGSDALVDSYAHAPVTIPVDQIPLAIIPMVQGRKTNAAIDSEITLRISKGGNSDSASKDLITQFDTISNRFTALPDVSALTEANINLTEVAIVSSGVYS